MESEQTKRLFAFNESTGHMDESLELSRRLDALEALKCDRTARNVDEWLDRIMTKHDALTADVQALRALVVAVVENDKEAWKHGVEHDEYPKCCLKRMRRAMSRLAAAEGKGNCSEKPESSQWTCPRCRKPFRIPPNAVRDSNLCDACAIADYAPSPTGPLPKPAETGAKVVQCAKCGRNIHVGPSEVLLVNLCKRCCAGVSPTIPGPVQPPPKTTRQVAEEIVSWYTGPEGSLATLRDAIERAIEEARR